MEYIQAVCVVNLVFVFMISIVALGLGCLLRWWHEKMIEKKESVIFKRASEFFVRRLDSYWKNKFLGHSLHLVAGEFRSFSEETLLNITEAYDDLLEGKLSIQESCNFVNHLNYDRHKSVVDQLVVPLQIMLESYVPHLICEGKSEAEISQLRDNLSNLKKALEELAS